MQQISALGNITIGLYGDSAEHQAVLLGNKNTVTGDSLGDVIAEINYAGVAVSDTIILNSSKDSDSQSTLNKILGEAAANSRWDDNLPFMPGAGLRHIVADPQTPAALVLARATSDLYSDLPEVSGAFVKLYNDIVAQKVVSEQSSTAKDALLAKLDAETTFEFPRVQPTAEVSEKVSAEARVVKDFMEKV